MVKATIPPRDYDKMGISSIYYFVPSSSIHKIGAHLKDYKNPFYNHSEIVYCRMWKNINHYFSIKMLSQNPLGETRVIYLALMIRFETM